MLRGDLSRGFEMTQYPERALRTEGSDAGLQRKTWKAVHQKDPSTTPGMTLKKKVPLNNV